MAKRSYSDVWSAIENTPGEAANLRLRSELMITLKGFVKQQRLSSEDAAKRLGVTLPRFSELMQGKINRFEIDALVSMVASAGLHVEMTVVQIRSANVQE